jgi:hypothetical protein
MLKWRKIPVGRIFSSPIIIDFNVVKNYLLSLSKILKSAMMNKSRFYRKGKYYAVFGSKIK